MNVLQCINVPNQTSIRVQVHTHVCVCVCVCVCVREREREREGGGERQQEGFGSTTMQCCITQSMGCSFFCGYNIY